MIPFEPHPRQFGPYLPPRARRRRAYDDRQARRPPPRKSALNPGAFSWLDGRSKPGPTDKDFALLRSITASPAYHSLELPVEEAYALAEKALKGHIRRQMKCVTNSNVSMTAMQKQKLPFQVFNELDAEFFRCMLKGNVSLGWSDLPSDSFSRTGRAGRKENPRIRIELSPSLYRHGSRYDILAALIHQMIHAYYLQCCGYRDRGHTGDGHDLEHEQPFQALLKTVSEHCGPLRKVLPANLWTLPRNSQNGFSNDPTSGASYCYGQTRCFNDVDIQDWRDVAIAKAESMQEAQKSKETLSQNTDRFSPQIVYIVDKDGIEYPPKSMKDWQYPPEAYVYLRFDNRSYPIARSSIADLAGLTSSPCFKERSYLHIPQGTGDSDFLALYFFLAYGQYPPSLKHLNQALASNEPVSQGPPKIISHDVEAPNHLVWLVTAFQLGKALQYKPFYDFFIKGLYSSHSTAEDPVAVLEKIYKTQRDWDHVTASTSKAPVDAQLREWTKCWLAVRLPALEMAQLGSPYRTNLAVVSMHPSWRARYAQLKASSLELREDDSIANSMFEKTAPAPQPPALPLFQHLMPPQDASNVPMRYSRSNGMPPGQQRASLPSHPGEEGRYFDLSSLSQYLPEDHLQYPRGQTVLSPQPGRGLPDHEAYETLLLSQEERLRNWLRSQISENPYGTFNQQALPDPERPRRPY